MKPIFANLGILRPSCLFKSSKYNEEKFDTIFANSIVENLQTETRMNIQ